MRSSEEVSGIRDALSKVEHGSIGNHHILGLIDCLALICRLKVHRNARVHPVSKFRIGLSHCMKSEAFESRILRSTSVQFIREIY